MTAKKAKVSRLGHDPLDKMFEERRAATAEAVATIAGPPRAKVGNIVTKGTKVNRRPGRGAADTIYQASASAPSATSSDGLPAGWTRATIIIRADLIEQVRAVAAADMVRLQDTVERALTSYLKRTVKPKELAATVAKYRKAMKAKETR